MISNKIRQLVIRSSVGLVLLCILGVGIATPIISGIVGEHWKAPVIYTLLFIIITQIIILGNTISKLIEAANQEDSEETTQLRTVSEK